MLDLSKPTLQWESKRDLPDTMRHVGLASESFVDGTDYIFAFGGIVGPSDSASDKILRYSIKDDQWTELTGPVLRNAVG